MANVLACYLRRMYEAETFVAQRLLAMVKQPFETGRSVEKLIREIEVQQGIDYAPQQRQAVALAAHEGVLVITGGPGTGKTTSTRGIVTLFERMGLEGLLLAPTGRAAKRMGERCGREAQTIHRCLGMSYNEASGGVTFRKGPQEPLEADAVVVLDDGRWGAVEVKLGEKQVEEGAAHLSKLASRADDTKEGAPSFLMALTGQQAAYCRPDGVYVVPITCLAP